MKTNTSFFRQTVPTFIRGIAIGALACLNMATLSSCSSDPDQEIHPPGIVDMDFAILPSSGLGSIDAGTRAVIRPAEDTDLAVSVFRIDQTAADTYPTNYATAGGPFAADLQGNTKDGEADAKINFSAADKQYYLSDGKKTKVIALYPAITSTPWTPSTAEITYTIDGKTDIMGTALGEGYKNVAVNPPIAVQPTGMEFTHLLTQIHVRIYATDANARDNWGDVKRINVRERETGATVTLPGITTTNYPTLRGGATKAPLPLTKEDGTDAPILGKDDIPTTNTTENPAVTFGYCMFAPVTQAATLPLTIVTEKNSVETSTDIVVAAVQTYIAGTAYTITLKLTSAAIIPESVTIADWASQNVNEIEI